MASGLPRGRNRGGNSQEHAVAPPTSLWRCKPPRLKPTLGPYSLADHPVTKYLAGITDTDVPLPVLAVSDFNTNGLGGHWNRRRSRRDRFFNLVLSIGGSLKWEDEEEGDADTVSTLGSYGFGKMVFALNSDLRIVVYHSTFPSDPDTEGVRCRAMATAFLPQHTIENTDYAGQAYYGIDSHESANPRKPLVDRDAHAWARSLGLPKRLESDPGTTVMVPAAGATMQEIVECCDRWWWPRMQNRDPNRQVEFEFVDEGDVLPGGRPRSRPELSPYIDCAKLLKAHSAGDRYDLRDVTVQPPGGVRKAGRLVLKAVEASRGGTRESDLTNHIALVRDGLVIRYANEFAHEDRPPVVGVFEPDANAESMQAFVFSEPPAHDDWVEAGDRLRGKYAWGRDFIRLTKGRLRSLTRDFQTRQEEAPRVDKTDAAEFLRRALRNLFALPGKGRPAPSPARARAFTVEIRDAERRKKGKSLEDVVRFCVGLSEHVSNDEVPVDLVLALEVLADDVAKPMDTLPPAVEVQGQILRGSGKRTVIPLDLTRSEPVHGEARVRVHPAWKTRWEIAVERR